MSNITITLFVKPESFSLFMTVLLILNKLPFENDYEFTPSDLNVSEIFQPNVMQINIDHELFVKFRYRYDQLISKK